MPILSNRQRYTSKTYTTQVGKIITETTVLTPCSPSAATNKKRSHDQDNDGETSTAREEDAKRYKQDKLADVLTDVEILGVQHRHTYRSYERSLIFRRFARECWHDHNVHLDEIKTLATQKWDECDTTDFNGEIDQIEWTQRLTWMKNDDGGDKPSTPAMDEDDTTLEIVEGVAWGMLTKEDKEQSRVGQLVWEQAKEKATGRSDSVEGVRKPTKNEPKEPIDMPETPPKQVDQEEGVDEGKEKKNKDETKNQVSLKVPLLPKQKRRMALQKLAHRRKERASKPPTVMLQTLRHRR